MSRKPQKLRSLSALSVSAAAGAMLSSTGAADGLTVTDISSLLRVHSRPLQVWNSSQPLNVKVSSVMGLIICLNRAVPSK